MDPRGTRGANRGQATLDIVLRLEVAPRHVVRACEGDEGDLPLLPERIDAVAQRGVQTPDQSVARVRKGQCGVRIRGIGARHREPRTSLVIEGTADGNNDNSRVVAAAKKR